MRESSLKLNKWCWKFKNSTFSIARCCLIEYPQIQKRHRPVWSGIYPPFSPKFTALIESIATTTAARPCLPPCACHQPSTLTQSNTDLYKQQSDFSFLFSCPFIFLKSQPENRCKLQNEKGKRIVNTLTLKELLIVVRFCYCEDMDFLNFLYHLFCSSRTSTTIWTLENWSHENIWKN